jgi:hypothetical protein
MPKAGIGLLLDISTSIIQRSLGPTAVADRIVIVQELAGAATVSGANDLHLSITQMSKCNPGANPTNEEFKNTTLALK